MRFEDNFQSKAEFVAWLLERIAKVVGWLLDKNETRSLKQMKPLYEVIKWIVGLRKGEGRVYVLNHPPYVEIADLGEIVVPDGYNHLETLESLRQEYRRWYGDSIELNPHDFNFSSPSQILKPGDRLLVKAYAGPVFVPMGYNDAMAFFDDQTTVFPGLPGLDLLRRQKNNLLPGGYNYYSLDVASRLLRVREGLWLFPFLNATDPHLGVGLQTLDDEFLYGWHAILEFRLISG